VSSSVQSAIWKTTTACRPRHPPLARAPRRALSTLVRETPSASAAPESRAVSTEMASANRRTRQSGPKSTESARRLAPMSLSGGNTRTTEPFKTIASSTPPAAPSPVSRKLSVSICLASRPLVAPSASRTAISSCRPATRVSNNPVTLALTISRSRPTDMSNNFSAPA
jgi:hypothetical protein